MRKSIFVSHSSKDFRIAAELCERLEKIGVGCWIAPRDIPAGSAYGSAIIDGLSGCSVCLLILSENANQSWPVTNEIERAASYQKIIVPLRVREVKPGKSIELFVMNAQWVDAFASPIADRVEYLAAVVRAAEEHRPPPTPLPERKDFGAKVEHFLERALRYKMVSITVAVLLLASLSGGTLLTLDRLRSSTARIELGGQRIEERSERIEAATDRIESDTKRAEAMLRDLLDRGGDLVPVSQPRTADEFLFNAIVLQGRDQIAQAADALMEALRREPTPRPDTFLLHELLRETRLPTVQRTLDNLPAELVPQARDYILAMRRPLGAGRIAALQALAEAEPDDRLTQATLAQALAAGTGIASPTVMRTAQAVKAAERHLKEPGYGDFVARFLRPSDAATLRQQSEMVLMRRALTERRLAVMSVRMSQSVATLSLSLPEPAQHVEWQRDGGAWMEVQPVSAGSPQLRLLAPWHPGQFSFRYFDADGVAAAPVAWRFDPVSLAREGARRRFDTLGPFAFYHAVRLGAAVPPLSVSGGSRAGLSAIEWFTDVDRRVRTASVGVSDEALLRGEPSAVEVPFQVPPGARTLLLTAILQDGTRLPAYEVPIR